MRPADVFFDAITQIREELVEEAQQYVFRRRISWRQYAGAAAACLALALGLSLLIRSGGAGGMGGSSGGSDSGGGMEDSCDIAPEPSEPLPSERSFTMCWRFWTAAPCSLYPSRALASGPWRTG